MAEPRAITQAASVILSIVDFYRPASTRYGRWKPVRTKTPSHISPWNNGHTVNTGRFRGPSVPPGFTEYENH